MEKKRRDERGTAALYALFAAAVAAGLSVALLGYAHSANRTTGTEADRLRSEYLAEGAIEFAKKELQTRIANHEPAPTEGTATIDNETVPYTLAPAGFTGTSADASGVQTISTHYHVDATGRFGKAAFRANRLVSLDQTPLFQFAVFYTNDLEIVPGPNMQIRGRIHTNADLYLASNATLTLNSNYVHAAGDIFRNRKDAPAISPGTVNARQWVADPFLPAEPAVYQTMFSHSQLLALGVPNVSGYDSNFAGLDLDGNGSYADPGDWLPWAPGALERWQPPTGYLNGSGHTVLTGEHGVTELLLPGTRSTEMFVEIPAGTGGDYDWNSGTQTYVPVTPGTGAFERGYYHASAGLSILTLPNGTWIARDGSGNDVTSSLSGVVSMKQMYDARQGGSILLTEINVGALNASGQFPANGLLYAARYGEGTGTQANGIRLTNGAELNGPLTVVTEDPLFVRGDYNSVAKKPAAVIGDAVNLLSNSWNDTKTPGTLPDASPTTYNVAVVTGNHDSSVGAYNGGFENLPRFHENWTGKACSITGSFVNAWLSQFGTGAWAYGGDRYTAPNRIWFYDTAFNNLSNLPPFTPMAVSARDVVTW
ncbi:MAG TPA: hypothetical protein VFI25_06775 [Planctomycetota bacterium]|jgi:hypothetical protein|nr:hypothetical protein [Planctomycetota bacterium]